MIFTSSDRGRKILEYKGYFIICTSFTSVIVDMGVKLRVVRDLLP